MKSRVAILAALPREIEPFIRNWPVRSVSRRDGTVVAENGLAIAACAGMGRERVAHALTLAEARGPLCAIFSVGYAGALRPSILRNSVYWPATIIDAETNDSYECAGGSDTLVTVARVLGREEKPRVATRWNADLVDMEAAAVAKLAQQRGIPFRTLRVVSDELDDTLPDFNRFINAQGGFREGAFAVYLAVHPWLIPTAIRLGRDSKTASHTIAAALREALEQAD